jgi:hypothetical protein
MFTDCFEMNIAIQIIGCLIIFSRNILSSDKGNNLVNGVVQYTERLLEEPAVLFGEYEH